MLYMEKTSAIPGFYKLPPGERLKKVKEFAGLSDEEVSLLARPGPLSVERADMMVENAIGTIGLPLGIATNFLINRKELLVPMALEEPSVVAAASNAAKLARPSGGFRASSGPPLMTGQVQLLNIGDPEEAARKVLSRKASVLERVTDPESAITKLGGGPKGLSARVAETERGRMLIVELLVDVRDAMGANAVNTVAERAAPLLEEITGGRAGMRILSNLSERRLARAEAVWRRGDIEKSAKTGQKGEEIVDAVLDAHALAAADIHRAATHNKGIMNGIDAVAVATGNDFRALEAGAHSFAALGGYGPLTRYEKTPEGHLRGSIELPLAAGTVGGSTKTNPTARACLKILGAASSRELAEIMASVGLAQNFAALRALATEGIQRGHMGLHAKNLAVSEGADRAEAEEASRIMISRGTATAAGARKALEEIRANK